jgi:LPS-assembly lipoprotein
MSLFDRPTIRSTRRAALLLALAGFAMVVSACTVTPLYSAREDGSTGTMPVAGTVGIAPVSDRVAQQVRNRLVFLFTGGSAEPAAPDYTVTLTVTRALTAGATVQRPGLYEPTAGVATVTASYMIRDRAGVVKAKGRRVASAAYDRPQQEYAVLRAARDAEDRAAREVAELLRLAIGTQLR